MSRVCLLPRLLGVCKVKRAECRVRSENFIWRDEKMGKQFGQVQQSLRLR